MRKYTYVLLLLSNLLVSCTYEIKIEATKLSPIVQPVEKILFIEHSERRTTEFFNVFRKEISFEAQKTNLQTNFVRHLDTDENAEKRFLAAIEKHQPTALLELKTGEMRTYKRGLLRNSVRKLNLNATMKAVPSGEKLWEGQLFVDQRWGSDVIADKVAKQLLQRLAQDGFLTYK